MSLKDDIMSLFISEDDSGNRYYPSGYKDIIIQAGNLAQAREQELLDEIAQFREYGWLDPRGEMSPMNFDDCKRLYIKKDKL